MMCRLLKSGNGILSCLCLFSAPLDVPLSLVVSLVWVAKGPPHVVSGSSKTCRVLTFGSSALTGVARAVEEGAVEAEAEAEVESALWRGQSQSGAHVLEAS